jgi:hypothetical protein
MDLLYVLHSGTTRATRALLLWYENRTIPHSEARKQIEEGLGTEAAVQRKEYYTQLSKFTHRTYKALLQSFSLGRDDMLVHDSHSMSLLVLPETIAAGLAVLSDLISQSMECLAKWGPLDPEEIRFVWLNALEAHTVPRRFAPISTVNEPS